MSSILRSHLSARFVLPLLALPLWLFVSVAPTFWPTSAVASATQWTIYTYDANGNLTAGEGRSVTWDYENRPTRIVKGGPRGSCTMGTGAG